MDSFDPKLPTSALDRVPPVPEPEKPQASAAASHVADLKPQTTKTTDETAAPSEKPVHDRDVCSLTDQYSASDWLEFEVENNSKSVEEFQLECEQCLKKLEDDAQQSKCGAGIKGRTSGKKMKKGAVQKTDKLKVPDQNEYGKVHYKTGYKLLEVGYFDEALEHFFLALKYFTPGHYSLPELHYNIFKAYCMKDKHSLGTDHLDHATKGQIYHALWDSGLIHLGLLDEYKAHCNPLKAMELLKASSQKLSTLKHKGVGLFVVDKCITDIVSQLWNVFWPVIRQSDDPIKSLTYALEYIRIYSVDLSVDGEKTLMTTMTNLVLMIRYGRVAPLIEISTILDADEFSRFHKLWLSKELCGSEPERKRPSAQEIHRELEFAGFPERVCRIFKGSDLNDVAIKTLDYLLFHDLEDVISVIDLAKLYNPHASDNEFPKDLNLASLSMQHSSEISTCIFQGMCESVSQIVWVRDCLRALNGIDLERNIEVALLCAECLRDTDPGLSWLLKGICHWQSKPRKEVVARQCIEKAAMTYNHPTALLWYGDMLVESQAEQALKCYRLAGSAGLANGFIKAAEYLLSKTQSQPDLWNDCREYFESACSLLDQKSQSKKYQYCQLMTEYCEEFYGQWQQTQAEMLSAERSVVRHGDAKTTDKADVFPKSGEAVMDTDEYKVSDQKADPVEASALYERETVKKKPRQKDEGSFWKEFIALTDDVYDEDFEELDQKLFQLGKKQTNPVLKAYVYQKRAWLCKTRVEAMDFRNSIERDQLLGRGGSFVAEGVSRIVGYTVPKERIDSLNLDRINYTARENRCLASLFSTSRHIEILQADFSRSKKGKMAKAGKSLFDKADALNPRRISRGLAKHQVSSTKLTVDDPETFAMKKSALRDDLNRP